MKKILLLVCFGLFLINGLFAQEIDFKYKVDSIMLNGNVKYIVQVDILKGEAPFSVGIYEDLYKDGFLPVDTKENVMVNMIKLEVTSRKKNYVIFVRSKMKSSIKPLIF